MGAGASYAQIYNIKYNAFQRMLYRVRKMGGSGTYKNGEINCELFGHKLRAYFGVTQRASNGESCAFVFTGIDGGEMEHIAWDERIKEVSA